MTIQDRITEHKEALTALRQQVQEAAINCHRLEAAIAALEQVAKDTADEPLEGELIV